MNAYKYVLGTAAAAFALGASNASAALILKLASGADMVTVEDDDNDGVVQYVGSVGTFSVTAMGSGAPDTGSLVLPGLNLDVDATSAGAGTLVISFSQTGNNSGGVPLNFSSSVTGSIDDDLEYQAYLDDDNNAFGENDPVGDIIESLGPIISLDGETDEVIDTDGVFSVTQKIIITSDDDFYSDTTDVTATLSSTAVSEPGALGLLGVGLLGLGVAIRRRK